MLTLIDCGVRNDVTRDYMKKKVMNTTCVKLVEI